MRQSKTGRRLLETLARLRDAINDALRGTPPPAPPPPEPPRGPDPNLAVLRDIERLSAARLRQAEQIFEFEAVTVAAKASVDALRFADILLGLLLAAQLVVGMVLLEGIIPAPQLSFAILGLGAILVCWGLALSRMAEDGPVAGTFLTDLAADPGSARATAVIRAAGIARRNDGRRVLKLWLFAFAVAVTVGDCAWAAYERLQSFAAVPAAQATPAATPAPTPRPTARPTPRPTPPRRGRHGAHRR
jgi:hypothetical protein